MEFRNVLGALNHALDNDKPGHCFVCHQAQVPEHGSDVQDEEGNWVRTISCGRRHPLFPFDAYLLWRSDGEPVEVYDALPDWLKAKVGPRDRALASLRAQGASA